jgi:hypothetical protein
MLWSYVTDVNIKLKMKIINKHIISLFWMDVTDVNIDIKIREINRHMI